MACVDFHEHAEGTGRLKEGVYNIYNVLSFSVQTEINNGQKKMPWV